MIDTESRVRDVLAETLSLGERANSLRADSPLFGAVPELDSQAVLHVLMALEEAFDIEVEDDDVDASVFEDMASLTALVQRKLDS